MIKPLEQLSPNSTASSPCAELRRDFLYISYVDDSGSSGTNLEDRQVPFQVIGGPLIDDAIYSHIQIALATEILNLVPSAEWESFEFPLLSKNCGSIPAPEAGPRCDKGRFPWHRRCENRKNVWSPHEVCC